MKNLVITTASVLALGLASAGIAGAQTSSSGTSPTPSTSTPMRSSPAMSQSSQGQVNLSESQVRQVQQQLKSAGLYKGAVDGEMGPETKQAVEQFQKQNGLDQTGVVDQHTLSALTTNQGGTGSTTNTPGAQPSVPRVT